MLNCANKTLRFHNYKAFRNTSEIEIKPITILSGHSERRSILGTALCLSNFKYVRPNIKELQTARFPENAILLFEYPEI